MNACSSCKICKTADVELGNFISTLDCETSHHRVISQSNKCNFGLQGICCKSCSNGPCKITPKSPRGVCGADAHTIVARNFLRAVAAGSGCYIHIVENTARNLKNTALNRETIKGLNALDRLAEAFDVKETDTYEKAIKVADKVLSDLYKPSYEKMDLVEKISYLLDLLNGKSLTSSQVEQNLKYLMLLSKHQPILAVTLPICCCTA